MKFQLPSGMWSDEYQVDLLKSHFLAFDKLRTSGILSGEMVWVFADFATPQGNNSNSRSLSNLYLSNENANNKVCFRVYQARRLHEGNFHKGQAA